MRCAPGSLSLSVLPRVSTLRRRRYSGRHALPGIFGTSEYALSPSPSLPLAAQPARYSNRYTDSRFSGRAASHGKPYLVYLFQFNRILVTRPLPPPMHFLLRALRYRRPHPPVIYISVIIGKVLSPDGNLFPSEARASRSPSPSVLRHRFDPLSRKTSAGRASLLH